MPAYSISRISKVQKEIAQDLTLASCVGMSLQPDALPIMEEALWLLLKKRVDRPIIRTTLLGCCDGIVSVESLVRLGWLVAGNEARLRMGSAVLPWTTQRYKEEVPAEILDCEALKTQRGPRVRFRLRVLAGQAAGLVVDFIASPRFVPVLASHLGIPRRSNPPFRNPRELVGFRTIVQIEPGHRQGRPSLSRVVCEAAMATHQQHNRDLWVRRQRMKARCEFGFPRAKPCFLCEFGRDKCALACRPRTRKPEDLKRGDPVPTDDAAG